VSTFPLGNRQIGPRGRSGVPLVLSERDYKLLTMFQKIAGIFLFSAGTIVLVDHGRWMLGLGLVAFGTLIVLAPVPMSIMRPDTYTDDEDTVGVPAE
jgi:hypothetical protein